MHMYINLYLLCFICSKLFWLGEYVGELIQLLLKPLYLLLSVQIMLLSYIKPIHFFCLTAERLVLKVSHFTQWVRKSVHTCRSRGFYYTHSSNLTVTNNEERNRKLFHFIHPWNFSHISSFHNFLSYKFSSLFWFFK